MPTPDPVFETDDVIVCRRSEGYNLTKGRDYIVLQYEATFLLDRHQFPAYVRIRDDFGDSVVAHADRFEAKA